MRKVSGKRFLVTGGGGFIGSHLTRRLLEMGAASVVVVDDCRLGDPANLCEVLKEVQIVKHRLGADDPKDLASHLRGRDAVFHLAAEKLHQSLDAPHRLIRSNLDGTWDVATEAARAGVPWVGYSSSLYAYGHYTLPPSRETDVPRPTTLYGTTKLAGEHALATVHRDLGLDFTILRYYFVYGPQQFSGTGYPSIIVKNFGRILKGLSPVIFGNGEQALNYVYVTDAVAATLAAYEQEAPGEVFNVAADEAVTVAALTKTMLEVAGSDVVPETGPADWTEGTCRTGENGKIRQTLGWRPTVSLKEGLKNTFSWMKSRGTL